MFLILILIILLFFINNKLNKIINLLELNKNNTNKNNILYTKDSYIDNNKENTDFGHYDLIRSDLGENGNSLNSKIKNLI
jgi:hypothetical protein